MSRAVSNKELFLTAVISSLISIMSIGFLIRMLVFPSAESLPSDLEIGRIAMLFLIGTGSAVFCWIRIGTRRSDAADLPKKGDREAKIDKD